MNAEARTIKAEPAIRPVEDRLEGHDWRALAAELDAHGCAVLPGLLDPGECREIAALYPQDVISAGLMDSELDQPALVTGLESSDRDETLSGAVERHLSVYFGEFGDRLPPPGLYHRILKEIEVPLLTAALAATRGNQIRAADLLGLNRNTLRKKIRDLDIQVYRSGS